MNFNYAVMKGGVKTGVHSSTMEIIRQNYIPFNGEAPVDGSTYENGVFIAPVNEVVELPKVTFSNVLITSNTENGLVNYFGIRTLKQGTDWTLTADVSDPNNLLVGLSAMNIIIEKVVNQSTVVSDERFNAVLDNGTVTITAPDGFESTGNYMLTAKRQNEGLVYLGLPFEIKFETVEFDVQRN